MTIPPRPAAARLLRSLAPPEWFLRHACAAAGAPTGLRHGEGSAARLEARIEADADRRAGPHLESMDERLREAAA